MDYVKNSNQNEICLNKNTRAAKESSLERIPLCLVKHIRCTSHSYLHSLPPVLHLCESFSHLFFGPGLKVIFKKCKPEKLLPLLKPWKVFALSLSMPTIGQGLISASSFISCQYPSLIFYNPLPCSKVIVPLLQCT